MVLETNAVYEAIQILSEKGYFVIDQGFLGLVLPLGIFICIGTGIVIGYFIGKKTRLKSDKDE